MRRSLGTIVGLSFLCTAVLTSCRKGNDNVKKEDRVEDVYHHDVDEEQSIEDVEDVEKEYPGADRALLDSLKEAENAFLEATRSSDEAAEKGDRETAQRQEEKRKSIRKKINELRNKLEEQSK